MERKSLLTVLFVLLAMTFAGCFLNEWFGFSSLFIEEATGKTPEAMLTRYVKSVASGDQGQAFAVWVNPEALNGNDREKFAGIREKVTEDLIAAKVSPGFTIKDIEWWSTCCVPHVMKDSRAAGRAKFYVEFTDANNAKLDYVFDFEVPGGYDGGLTGYSVREWKIKDAYPKGGYPAQSEPSVAGWKVYESKSLGFRVDYPSDWKEEDSSPNYAWTIYLVNPETSAFAKTNKGKLQDQFGSMEDYFYSESDITIAYFDSLNFSDADTIDEYIDNPDKEKIGETQIDGARAVEVVDKGELPYYMIMFENKGHFYEIRFNKTPNKEAVSETQRKIISSFRFIG